MNKRIVALLESLYAGHDVRLLAEQLQDIIEKRKQMLNAAVEQRDFSENDIALITYGDTLIDENQVPLQVLKAFLDKHLKDSISLVHILPFHPYSSDDGFSVIDFEQVNPILGKWVDIHAIGEQFELMADFVLNHMSAQSPWFQAFLDGEAAYQDLYMTASLDDALSQVTRPRTSPLLTPFTTSAGETVQVWTTFSADQVDFDYRQPSTMLRMIDILLNYITHGARVIRLDAIAYLWKEIGTNCIHLPQTHAFVQLMRAVLDEVAPGVWLITETNVPHQENISYFGDGTNEAQLVYNFTLPPLLLYSMLNQDVTLLQNWINTLAPISDHTAFFNFTASHDGIGVRPLEGIISPEEIKLLATAVEERGGFVSYRNNPDGSESPYELNITYINAVTTPDTSIEEQAQQFMVSQAIMLALAGVPAIYIHSLLGSRNDLTGVAEKGHKRAINRAQLDWTLIQQEINDPASLRSHVFEAYKHYLSVRRASPFFDPNLPQHALDIGDPGILVIARTRSETEQLYAINNVTPHHKSVRLPSIEGQQYTDILTGEHIASDDISLAPFGVRWLVTGDS